MVLEYDRIFGVVFGFRGLGLNVGIVYFINRN